MKIRKFILIFVILSCLVSLFGGCSSVSNEPKITVTRVTISGANVTNNALTMMEGEKVSLAAAVSPSDATNKNVTWASANTAAATVSQSGELTAIGEGSAEITATADGVKGVLTVTVMKGGPLTAISFAQPTVDVNVGSTAKLSLNLDPSDTTEKNILYSILADAGAVEGKAVINAMGTVEILTGAKGGSTYTVTAVSQKNSAIKATCKIRVREVPLKSLSVRRNNEAIDLATSAANPMEIPIDAPKNALFFVPVFMPENTSQREVTYTSSDTSVLEIKQYDNLAFYSVGTGAKVGKTITVTVKGQNNTSLTVYVKIVEAKHYLAGELTAAYLNSLTADKRILWDIEKNTSKDNYDTAGTAPLSTAIWRGSKSTTTYGGVNPWDGVWGIIFDSWDSPYLDNELPNQYMYNKVSLANNANFIEFRVRSHTTPTTSERGKFRVSALVSDGKGGYSAPVVLKKVKGISSADANGWIEISNCTVADYEAGRDYFYFDISAYKGKTVVFFFEVDDMHDKGLEAGKKDSGLCDRICFLGANIQETVLDRTKKQP